MAPDAVQAVSGRGPQDQQNANVLCLWSRHNLYVLSRRAIIGPTSSGLFQIAADKLRRLVVAKDFERRAL